MTIVRSVNRLNVHNSPTRAFPFRRKILSTATSHTPFPYKNTMAKLESNIPLSCEVQSPEDIECMFRRIQAQHPELASEFQIFSQSKVHHWRTVCRLACVNTTIRLGTHLNQERALRLTRTALGKFCPPDKTLKKDAFRAIAIAFSLLARTLVTPKMAFLCFRRGRDNQRFQITEYGNKILCAASVSWPPTTHEVDLVDIDWESAELSLHCHPAYASELPDWISNLDVESLGLDQLQPPSDTTPCDDTSTTPTRQIIAVPTLSVWPNNDEENMNSIWDILLSPREPFQADSNSLIFGGSSQLIEPAAGDSNVMSIMNDIYMLNY
jgi:hypothetical protein